MARMFVVDGSAAHAAQTCKQQRHPHLAMEILLVIAIVGAAFGGAASMGKS